jgi:hypothetical protein
MAWADAAWRHAAAALSARGWIGGALTIPAVSWRATDYLADQIKDGVP